MQEKKKRRRKRRCERQVQHDRLGERGATKEWEKYGLKTAPFASGRFFFIKFHWRNFYRYERLTLSAGGSAGNFRSRSINSITSSLSYKSSSF